MRSWSSAPDQGCPATARPNRRRHLAREELPYHLAELLVLRLVHGAPYVPLPCFPIRRPRAYSNSRMVALAWPPPSHMTCSP